jgi:hypothetical protein
MLVRNREGVMLLADQINTAQAAGQSVRKIVLTFVALFRLKIRSVSFTCDDGFQSPLGSIGLLQGDRRHDQIAFGNPVPGFHFIVWGNIFSRSGKL